jgi:hypothetical protein
MIADAMPRIAVRNPSENPHVSATDKRGSFYLGRPYDLNKKDFDSTRKEPWLYDANDLTTHAVCLGMTGSGKTGLCLALLEEAALNQIPAIAIDPKGDLGNLLLAFPNLKPEDFQPWIEEGEAQRAGCSVAELAERRAETWKNGLAHWDEDGTRIQKYVDAVDRAIYTPGSNAGIQLTVLRSFAPPPKELLEDSEARNDLLTASVSGLLAFVGIEADPVRSREHILLSQILERAWLDGKSLDIPAIIRNIQTPPFDKVGMVDVETFFPAKDRTAMAMQLNNLIASPGFAVWMEGEPLDIQRLFYTADNKPRLTIINIAHLNDAERMSFVTILLGELLAWVRTQPGTSNLRALFYMDEVYGYFPPSRNPPCKQPMLTLLKQARAFGLGVMLATQNPVDLDYKGLANMGTWFIGRLQTERDKARVMEGLEGASASANSSFDRARTEQLLAGLGSRVFLMKNVHDDEPTVFQSRWCMSYLCGPLSRSQIKTLMAPRKKTVDLRDTTPLTMDGTVRRDDDAAKPATKVAKSADRPLVPAEANEMFAVPKRPPAATERIEYRPALLGAVRLHYVEAKSDIDQWSNFSLVSTLDDSTIETPWKEADEIDEGRVTLEKQPLDTASFADLPGAAGRAKSYAGWQKDLVAECYSSRPLKLFRCDALETSSKPTEKEADFRTRIEAECKQQAEAEKKKITDSYAKKFTTLDGQIQRANQQLKKQKGQRWQKIINALMGIITAILGAIGGKKIASQRNITAAATAARRASTVASEQGDVKHAEETTESLQQRRADQEAEQQGKLNEIDAKYDVKQMKLSETTVAPRKTDIGVNKLALVWLPYKIGPGDESEPAY